VHISVVGVAWTLYNATLILVVSFAPDALVLAGYPPGDARSLTSLFMWTAMISIPLGGRILQTLGRVTAAVSVSLLASSVTLVFVADGASPLATFILFGVFAGIPAGALMAMSAQAVSRENRGPGLGIFYTWYYVGMTLMPVLAGWLRDWTGSAKAPVLLSAILAVGTVLCVWLLRGLQGTWPIERDRHQPVA
jgi:MFS family permease